MKFYLDLTPGRNVLQWTTKNDKFPNRRYMPMTTTPSLSVRLSPEVRERLERAASRMKRSRSFLVQEALMRHLDDVETVEKVAVRSSRLEKLRSLKGAGALIYGPLSAEQIDADIREFRGDE